MPSIPIHETSVRAVVPQKDHGKLVLCGLPGLRISLEGLTYFDPEHAVQTFEYLGELQVALIYLFMEDFELPPKARQMIDDTASSCKIKTNWIPIVDYGIPEDVSEGLWKEGRAERSDCLMRGETIAVTCLYGAGRSGMMAAAVSAEMGINANKAVHYVRQYFAEAVGSREQENWVSQGSYLT